MRQGQSSITPLKESAFRGILSMNLAVQKKSRYAYHQFDLNAGSGYNQKAECPGSPVVFLDAAQFRGITNYWAHFVDCDRSSVEKLLARVSSNPRCICYNGDNREFVTAIPELIRWTGERPGFALGSVLCDPNGTDLPIEELEKLSLLCPRLDFILNYPARVWKRCRGAGFIDSELYLTQLTSQFHKKFWWVQQPLPDDHFEWMVIVGRNFEMGDWRTMRLYRLDSAKGVEIVRRSLSRRERNQYLF